MVAVSEQKLNPRYVRLDASTLCQLRCPSCPTTSGATGRKLGVGTLTFGDFKDFIRRNPNVAHIELSNWGEAFLNKDLIKILAYAYRHNVCLYLANGSNMNTVSPEQAETVVKYKLRRITCSIDGASQETYVQYRVRGDFDRVIENIRLINRIKAKYKSPYPAMRWQFVAFGHNQHEIHKAKAMAASLGMAFFLKLSWDDMYGLPDHSPVMDKDLVSCETGLGVADRREYLAKYGRDYAQTACCTDMWKAPQMNYDGRMLGCPVNYWGDYGNVFEQGLAAVLNNDKMTAARAMLMGKVGPQKGIPCTTCNIYQKIREHKAWITPDDVTAPYRFGRRYTMFRNKILGRAGTRFLAENVAGFRKYLWRVRTAVKYGRYTEIFVKKDPRALPNAGYPLALPLAEDKKERWKPTFLFKGNTRGIDNFSCHASSLFAGHSPHPPHGHGEEEILIMLSGEADLLLPLYKGNGTRGRLHLKTGEFVYYPAGYLHSLKAAGPTTANYLMLKWTARKNHSDQARLDFGKYTISDFYAPKNGREGVQAKTVFEGPSSYLTRLHSHTSILGPGAGYKPHRDPYDVAIVLLNGEVETLGQCYQPYSVIFHPAGQKHGISNPGRTDAKYVVFEFER